MKTLIDYNRKLKTVSRRLRNNMTDAERLLWSKIRCKQISDVQFYRQKAIGNYITDFCCPKIGLVVEVDGGQHYEEKNKKADKIRDDYLKKHGFNILRFTNIDVLKNIDGVVRAIYLELNPSQPPFTKGRSKD